MGVAAECSLNLVLIGRVQVWRLSNYDMYMFTGTYARASTRDPDFC